MLEPIFARDGTDGAAMHGALESIHPWGRLGRPEDIAQGGGFSWLGMGRVGLRGMGWLLMVGILRNEEGREGWE